MKVSKCLSGLDEFKASKESKNDPDVNAVVSESSIHIFEHHVHYIRGSFKNGKLHGLVQIYGKMTVDPKVK